MDSSAITLKKLAEQVLKADGSMPLELLLVHLAPVERLREVAQNLGLSPKGGLVEGGVVSKASAGTDTCRGAPTCTAVSRPSC